VGLAEHLCQVAKDRGSSDNITTIVVFFKPPSTLVGLPPTSPPQQTTMEGQIQINGGLTPDIIPPTTTTKKLYTPHIGDEILAPMTPLKPSTTASGVEDNPAGAGSGEPLSEDSDDEEEDWKYYKVEPQDNQTTDNNSSKSKMDTGGVMDDIKTFNPDECLVNVEVSIRLMVTSAQNPRRMWKLVVIFKCLNMVIP